MHVVHLIGYLGKNPEHKSVKASDNKYAVLSLATQRSWKGADEEWHSKTEWHRLERPRRVCSDDLTVQRSVRHCRKLRVSPPPLRIGEVASSGSLA